MAVWRLVAGAPPIWLSTAAAIRHRGAATAPCLRLPPNPRPALLLDLWITPGPRPPSLKAFKLYAGPSPTPYMFAPPCALAPHPHSIPHFPSFILGPASLSPRPSHLTNAPPSSRATIVTSSQPLFSPSPNSGEVPAAAPIRDCPHWRQ